MLYFGRVGSSWGHCAFFGSSWGKKVITPKSKDKCNGTHERGSSVVCILSL
jgi:hypothetical protein